MDALFSSLSQSVDFLVLGAVATLVLCLPFGFKKPLEDGWCWLKSLMQGSHHLVQGGLLTVFLFSTFYFSGYLLNAAGHAVLHRAHFLVIQTAAETKLSTPAENPGVPYGFWWRAVPIIGHFAPSQPNEVEDYWADATRQLYWDVCDKQSSDDMLGGGALSELRLLRGAVGLIWILAVVCVIALILDHKKYERWSLSTLVGAGAFYAFLIIPSYWDVEYEEHSTIWAGFPRSVTLSTENMERLLPCRKMGITAAGKKASLEENASQAGNGGPQAQVPANLPKGQ